MLGGVEAVPPHPVKTRKEKPIENHDARQSWLPLTPELAGKRKPVQPAGRKIVPASGTSHVDTTKGKIE
jgi:hypothetical protein